MADGFMASKRTENFFWQGFGSILPYRQKFVFFKCLMPDISPLSKPEQGFITVDGFRLEYTSWPGDVQTMVALHGFGGTSRSFRKLALQLQPHGIGLVCIGLPWHGESKELTNNRLVLTRFAPALIATLQGLGIPKAPVIAHSFGARIALAMATLGKGFVNRLFLLAPGGFYPFEDYMFRAFRYPPGRWLMLSNTVSGFISGLMIPNLSGDHQLQAAIALRKMSMSFPDISLKHSGILGQLYNFDKPVHLLWGKEDRLVPVSFAYEIKQWFRYCDISEFAQAGHLLMAEQPEKLALRILERMHET